MRSPTKAAERGNAIMTIGDWIGVIGTLLGWGIAFYQWYDGRKKRNALVHFLLGLKEAELPPKAVERIDRMLGRLDARRQRWRRWWRGRPK
jgi:hypothetical protein